MHALDHHHRPQHEAASTATATATATATSSSSSSSDPYLKQCLELTHGHGIDLILEMLANVNLGYDLKLLAPNGRVCVIGNRGEAQMNARDLMTNEADIRGVYLPRSTDAQRAECVAALQAGWAAGALTPVVGQTFKLEEAAQAHELVMSHEPTLGKVVLDCTK
jgi:NADPH2:quinone reductase